MREYRLTTVRMKIDKQKDVNIAIFKELECYLFNFLAKERLIATLGSILDSRLS